VGHGLPPSTGHLSAATAAAAATGELRERNFVGLATVGALDVIVLGSSFLQFGQLLGNGSFVHIELATAIETGHGCHDRTPFLFLSFCQSTKA
jgi:hypothetical protein